MPDDARTAQEYMCSKCGKPHFMEVGSANEICPVHGTETLTPKIPPPPIAQSIDDWKRANPGRPF